MLLVITVENGPHTGLPVIPGMLTPKLFFLPYFPPTFRMLTGILETKVKALASLLPAFI